MREVAKLLLIPASIGIIRLCNLDNIETNENEDSDYNLTVTENYFPDENDFMYIAAPVTIRVNGAMGFDKSR